jgi:aminoglycoside phosphotransferase (APT) family kinase protein
VADAWAPEHVVDEALARALVEAQFEDLAGASLVPFGAGFDNTAYLVGGEWVLRFPRREIAVPLLETETRILPAIAASLPLAVPVPVLVGRPSDAYPWPFSGYRLLSGRTACERALDDRARRAAAPVLGAFVRALHDRPAEHIAALGLPGDTLRRADVAYRKTRVAELLLRLRAGGILDEAQARAFERAVAATPEASHHEPTLVHGDLYVRHLLVGDDGLPTGVIDWGDVHAGHRAIDLALGYSFLPPDARTVFFDACGGVTPELMTLARFRALYHTALVLEFATAIGDADLEREARLGLGWALGG